MAGKQRVPRASHTPRMGAGTTARGGTKEAGTARERRPLPRRVPLALGAVGVVALALVATAVLVRPPAATAQSCASGAHSGLGAGQCAPTFTLADLQNRRVSLAALRGRPLLLHFWGVPCTSCRAEYPAFLRAIHTYEPRGLTVVAVESWDSPLPLVQAWQQSHHLPAIMLVDPDGAAPALYGVTGTPTTVYIDRKGRISASVAATESYADFAAHIARIL